MSAPSVEFDLQVTDVQPHQQTDQQVEDLNKVIVTSLKEGSQLLEELKNKFCVGVFRKKGDNTKRLRLTPLPGNTSLEGLKEGKKNQELVEVIETYIKRQLPAKETEGWKLSLVVSKDSGFDEPEASCSEREDTLHKRDARQDLPQSGPGTADRPASAVFGLTAHKTGSQYKAAVGAVTETPKDGDTALTTESGKDDVTDPPTELAGATATACSTELEEPAASDVSVAFGLAAHDNESPERENQAGESSVAEGGEYDVPATTAEWEDEVARRICSSIRVAKKKLTEITEGDKGRAIHAVPEVRKLQAELRQHLKNLPQTNVSDHSNTNGELAQVSVVLDEEQSGEELAPHPQAFVVLDEERSDEELAPHPQASVVLHQERSAEDEAHGSDAEC